MNKKRGMTLVEISIMTLVGFLLMMGILKIFTQSLRQTAHGSEKVNNLRELTFFLEVFQGEVTNCEKIKEITESKLKLETLGFSKNTQKNFNYFATYEVVNSGSGIGWIQYTPEANGGTLPPELKEKKYFKGQLRKFKFNKLKEDLGIDLQRNRIAFQLDLEFFDPSTKAKLDFIRMFYPPMIGPNNPEEDSRPKRF